MPDSPISYVIPLGLRCTTAEVFKRINHRNFALPFDWIYSSPSLIIDCLQTSFTHLLDSSQLYKVGMKGTLPLIGHTRYAKHLESVSRSVFNHHDVMNEEGHEYLQRTVSRFTAILSEPALKLFAMCCLDDSLWQPALVHQLFAELAARTTNFLLIVVRCKLNVGTSDVSVLETSNDAESKGRMTVYEMSCIGNNTGQHFKNPADRDVLTSLFVAPPRSTDPFKFKLRGDPLK